LGESKGAEFATPSTGPWHIVSAAEEKTERIGGKWCAALPYGIEKKKIKKGRKAKGREGPS